jgi:hypothetical protein
MDSLRRGSRRRVRWRRSRPFPSRRGAAVWSTAFRRAAGPTPALFNSCSSRCCAPCSFIFKPLWVPRPIGTPAAWTRATFSSATLSRCSASPDRRKTAYRAASERDLARMRAKTRSAHRDCRRAKRQARPPRATGRDKRNALFSHALAQTGSMSLSRTECASTPMPNDTAASASS